MKGRSLKTSRRLEKKVQGSLTVEAALVLPIFIYVIIAFVYFIQIIGLQETLQNAITETGFYSAKYAYVYDYLVNYNESESEDSNAEESKIGSGENIRIVSQLIDGTFYKIKLKDFLDVDKIDQSCIKNGYAGIITYMSSFMEDEDTVDIILIYKIKLPILFIRIDEFQIVQRVRMRGWSGHKVAVKGASDVVSEEDGDTVYITETGTVYHLTKECSHLLLSIEETTYEQIENLRNTSGRKYKKCERCGDEGEITEESTVYITNSGDRYHSKLNCSGLKRTIIAISIKEVGNRSLCSRCSKNNQNK